MNIQNINSPTFKRLEISYDSTNKLEEMSLPEIHRIRKIGKTLENGTHYNLRLDEELRPTIKDNSKLFSYYGLPTNIEPIYGDKPSLKLQMDVFSNNKEKTESVNLCVKMKNNKEAGRVCNKLSQADDIEKASILVNLLDRDAKRIEDEDFCLKQLNTKKKLIDNVLHLYGANV